MYEQRTTSTCVLCLSISKVKYILSTMLSSASSSITSQTAVSCPSDYGTPFVYASNMNFKIMLYGSSLNDVGGKDPGPVQIITAQWKITQHECVALYNSVWDVFTDLTYRDLFRRSFFDFFFFLEYDES